MTKSPKYRSVAYPEWLSSELRVVQQLDVSIESVHVDVNDVLGEVSLSFDLDNL